MSAGLVPGKEITKAVALVEPLDSGGMGAVWIANHLGLKTKVVVKFMLVGMDSSDSARVRFSREAAAAAQVKSPHVVQMLDHGVSDEGTPFIVMEHLEGHDLGDEIAQHGALDFAKVVAIVSQVAKALTKVHGAGLLHRDIKPDNIFLCDGEDDTFVKLLDFGIAKSATPSDQGSLDGETKTGQIVGTPFYMSPEQVTAQKVIDHRSDLWALGVVAYEALTGVRPYDGPSFGALAVKIATGTADPPTKTNPNLPPAIDEWFAKACAREPSARFDSAKEMADAFRAVFEGVVSLPSSYSDSGARSGPRGSRPDSRETTGPRVPSSATLGLAATALDDSKAGAGKTTSPLVYVAGGLALVVAALSVVVVRNKNESPAPAPAVTVTVTQSAAPPPVAPASAASATPTVPASAVPAMSTAPPAKPASSAHPVAGPSAKPHSSAQTKPSGTPAIAKPASSEADLF